jgi:hypothetical protein
MDELYNLKDDPGETKNLLSGAGRRDKAPQINKVVEDFDAKMESWMKRVNDPVLKETRKRGWFEEGEAYD